MTSPASRSRTRGVGSKSASQRASINAGLGGIGGGTGLVAISQLVGSDTFWGALFMYAAPTISVVAGIVVYQIGLQTAWYAERWQIRRARKTLIKQLSDRNLSDDHKSKVRNMLEEIDNVVAEAELNRIKEIFPAR